MNRSDPFLLHSAGLARRCFLHFALFLVALGTWSIPSPEPLAVAGDFNLLDHFLNDQAGAVSQHESPRPAPRDCKGCGDEAGAGAFGLPPAAFLLGLHAGAAGRPWLARLLRRAPAPPPRPHLPRAPPALS